MKQKRNIKDILTLTRHRLASAISWQSFAKNIITPPPNLLISLVLASVITASCEKVVIIESQTSDISQDIHGSWLHTSSHDDASGNYHQSTADTVYTFYADSCIVSKLLVVSKGTHEKDTVLLILNSQKYSVAGDRLMLFGKNTLVRFYDDKTIMELEPDGEWSKMLRRLPDHQLTFFDIIDREEENTHISL